MLIGTYLLVYVSRKLVTLTGAEALLINFKLCTGQSLGGSWHAGRIDWQCLGT